MSPQFSPFPNKPWFLHVSSTSILKTLWEKEKLLVMSNSSFSHRVFFPFGELSATFNKFKIVVSGERRMNPITMNIISQI